MEEISAAFSWKHKNLELFETDIETKIKGTNFYMLVILKMYTVHYLSH